MALPLMPPRRRVVSNVIKGSIGNLVEWYDWFVYASFSLYFASVFFPKGDATVQLLSTTAVFAVGFLMRPLGSWILGLYTDRRGRRAGLTLSVTLMSVGSLIVALIPGYDVIGLGAPALLLAARLLQGLSVGGEYGSSATYLSEIATPGRRGFYSSFQYSSIIVGQLLALLTLIGLQSALTAEQLHAWGWRVPFLVGAVLGLVVLWLRRSMDESAHFQAGRTRPPEGEATGLRALIRNHPRQLVAVMLLTAGGTIAFYTFTTYALKYMVNTAGISKPDAAMINFFALLVFLFMQPAMGALSDRIGRRRALLAFAIGAVLFTVPILAAMGHTRNPWAAFLLMVAALAILSGYTACGAIVKAEMFPTHVRAVGVGLPYAIVGAVLGGTTESVALGLKAAGHEGLFGWYVTGFAALTLIALIMMKGSFTRNTIDVEPDDGGSQRGISVSDGARTD
ncbi:MFS transporter [Arthrobacter sp. SDTb3-6]|uniref:MFS transporter n=1 Tax=Arthrobacter sp. SDTb3-6 TaxID=2713571 RepID=UPI00181960E4|nr:MFS transporter [Arthrobacter sp. SDTb3-6]NVM98472.1 MFS transporter [Arthrobacter sp. SDTb3-6]